VFHAQSLQCEYGSKRQRFGAVYKCTYFTYKQFSVVKHFNNEDETLKRGQILNDALFRSLAHQLLEHQVHQ